jgi:Helicase HerA, central domain
LIGEDGGTPIYIDLFNPGNDKHRHIGVFGTTRSGKSVLVGGILTQGLARKIPIVAIDYPKPDGSSTYTTYTWFMGKRGAYFDVGKESVNMFDRPNLKSLSADKQKERFEDYKDFLCSCLQVMVMGESNDTLLNSTVRTLLYQTLNRFFDDSEILARYDLAEESGLGTEAWQQMPTLKDFLSYFQRLVASGFFESLVASQKIVAISNQSVSLISKATEQIALKLQYWTESRVGRAISEPSSVPTNAPLMVLALRQILENEDAAILFSRLCCRPTAGNGIPH